MHRASQKHERDKAYAAMSKLSLVGEKGRKLAYFERDEEPCRLVRHLDVGPVGRSVGEIVGSVKRSIQDQLERMQQVIGVVRRGKDDELTRSGPCRREHIDPRAGQGGYKVRVCPPEHLL
jgi:hypothetical protein